MIADDFAKQYLCNFVIDEKTRLLHTIAKEYHGACDAYDRIVGGARALPFTSQQHAQINTHARLVLKRLVEQYTGLSRLEIMRAIQKYPHC